MKKQRFLVLLTVICIVALLVPMAVSAAGVTEGFFQNADGTWSFGKDGELVRDDVIYYGGAYYGFDYEGVMYEEEFFWCYGRQYAKAGGSLLTNSWKQDEDGTWYYFEADGSGANGWKQMGGKWYFFEGGEWVVDRAARDWENDCYYVFDENGNYQAVTSKGWTQVYGDWYYVDADGWMADYGWYEIGGHKYCFEDYKMLTNTVRWVDWNEETYEEEYALLTGNGTMLKNGWYKLNGEWYYAEDGVLANGVTEIGGALYLFEGFKMYDVPGEYGDLFVTENGTLSRNAWYWDNTYTYEPGWAYFGDDGYRLTGDLYKLGGVYYYFDYDGIARTDYVMEYDGAIYKFGSNGAGLKLGNGWFQFPQHEDIWGYVQNGELLKGMQVLGGQTFYFDYDGWMIADTYEYIYVDTLDEYGLRVFNDKGHMITTPGWHTVGGRYYFVEDATGKVAEGWKQFGADWYYFAPYMYSNTVFFDYEYETYYAVNGKGVCTALTGNGFRNLSGYWFYLENGKPVCEDWRKIGGVWYYFQENGRMVSNRTYYIDDTCYLFDASGAMYTGGWLQIGTTYYYAGSDGVAYTGLQTVGGAKFLFDYSGALRTGGRFWSSDDETYYLIGVDGTLLLSGAKTGWNQVGGKWYYVNEDGYFANIGSYWIDGNLFYFDYNGVMQTGRQDSYYFGSNGAAAGGWLYLNGKWAYADPEYKWLAIDETRNINDKEYCFDEAGYMRTGTFIMWGSLVTTDANGAVTKWEELPDGYNYDDGSVIYIQNGNEFNGWLGDYYFEHGYMHFNTTVEYNGKMYYIGKDGRYLKSGWAETPWETYVLARADGTLYYNEWVKIGNTWYYFNYEDMVADGEAYIDGERHEFDENGKWLGAVEEEKSIDDMPVKADGWQMIGGKWYYYHAGTPVTGTRIIDGIMYAFDSEECGAMVANDFYSSRYFTASGAMAQYTGWVKLQGEWYYFTPNYTFRTGFVNSGTGGYYLGYVWNEDTEEDEYQMFTNTYMALNGRLYYFDASGYTKGAINGTGWHKSGSDWYYVEDGKVAEEGYKVIGGVGYYFGYTEESYGAVMLTNVVAYVRGGARLFGANGAEVTKGGWYKLPDGWAYVKDNGIACRDGAYKIGGTVYSFYDGLWVE